MSLTVTPPSELVDLSSIKTVKQVPYTEYFVSGHRTCQGCESALVMRYIAKAAGPRTIVLGSTGCMYVPLWGASSSGNTATVSRESCVSHSR
jgi:pyruvate/2-oxoacid:ferredoxin oxidoreductase beta subunit